MEQIRFHRQHRDLVPFVNAALDTRCFSRELPALVSPHSHCCTWIRKRKKSTRSSRMKILDQKESLGCQLWATYLASNAIKNHSDVRFSLYRFPLHRISTIQMVKEKNLKTDFLNTSPLSTSPQDHERFHVLLPLIINFSARIANCGDYIVCLHIVTT